MVKEPQLNDKVKVITKNGNKLLSIDSITKKRTHLKSKTFDLEVNSERIIYTNQSWRGANFYYVSLN